MRLPTFIRYVFSVATIAGTAAGAAEPVSIVIQNGLNSYEGTFDRRIGAGGEVDGLSVTGQTAFYVDGGADALDDAGYSNILIRFADIETLLPAGAKIIDAKMTVVTKTHSNAHSGDAFSVYRLTRGFNSESSTTTDFGPDGVLGDIDLIVGSFHGPNVAGEASVVSADVTRAVQSWVDGSPNLGLGIRCDRGTNAWSFHTTGATQALRPKLEIKYVVGDDARATDYQQGLDGYTEASDIFLNGTGATSTTPGTTIVGRTVAESWLDGLNPPTTEPDISAMMRFGAVETQLAGRKIESATLKVVTGFSSTAADSPGPFTVHRLLVPFDETSKYGDFAGDAGAMLAAGQITPAIATFTGMQDCEVVDVDVAEAVKAWAAGAPNHGFYIGSGTPNGWQIWTSGAFRTVAGQRVEEVRFRPLLRVVSGAPLPVEIVSPVGASRHVRGTPMTFQVSATAAAPATVSNVEFFIDGKSVGIDTSAPFTFNYPAATLGNFVLTAVVTDSIGGKVTSEPVNFSVVPASGIGGLYFDGISDHVALGDPEALKLSNFTIETWFRRETQGVATTTGTGGVVAIPLVAKGRNQADNSTLDTNWFLGIRESDGVLCADFEGAGGVNVPIAGATRVPYGAWQHAAATFDGTNFRIYLNGNLERVVNANGLMPRVDSIQHASIATAMNSNGLGEGAFGGFMDEVRVWNVGRTQAEIRQTINSEIPTAADLAARWSLNEGAGTTITSSTSAATAGTFGGAPIWTAGTTFSGNASPSIAFTGPSSEAFYINSSTIPFTVTTSDPDGTVAQVEYFDNGVSVAVTTTPPFTFNYANPPVGTRRITAEVTDNGGAKSRTDDTITAYVTFPSPTVPGYTAGIIDGKDIELSLGTPAMDPAQWSIYSSTTTPRAFTAPGTTRGELNVNVNGAPLAYSSGLLFATNAVVNGNFAPIDNIVSPFARGGIYRVSSNDNNGPGELEPQITPESSSFSLGWFPYNQGWVGANISAAGAVIGGSSSLPANVTITHVANVQGTYRIHGLPTSGNLIALAVGENSDNCATVGFEEATDSWIVTVRDNNQNLEDGDFGILYVPGTADRVLSGKIGNAAEFTGLNGEINAVGVTTRLTRQGYELTFGDGSVINPTNTVLFITADANAGNGPDNIYSYSANGNSFVVFSHDLPGLPGTLQDGGFRFLAVPLNPTAPAANEVTLVATDSSAAEDGADQTLSFTVTRKGSTATGMVVNYSVSGTATSGSDFTALPGSVTIPAGASSAVINVTVLPDSILEQPETVTLTLAAGGGYTVGPFNTGTGVIQDAGPAIATTSVAFQEGANGYVGTFQKRVGLALNGTQTAQLGSAVASYGIDGGDPDINDMLRFDNIIGSGPGQIPAGARVLKAELVLSTATSSNAQSNGPFIVDRLTSAVDANTTYLGIDGGITFEGVRGIVERPLHPAAGFPPAALGEVVAADVTDIVRAWAAGSANHGFGIFAAGTSDGWNYGTTGSTDIAQRPKLLVTYTTRETKEYTFNTDQSALISSNPGTPTTDGNQLDFQTLQNVTNNSTEALMRFPVVFDNTAANAIPLGEEVVKAELLVRTAASYDSLSGQSVGPVGVHQMLQNWTTASDYGLSGPKVGTHVGPSVATMTGMGQDSTTWVDVTSIVRNWRAGAPNYGVNLKSTTTDTWTIYWPGTILGNAHVPKLRITTSTGAVVEPGDDPIDLWATSFGASGVNMSSDNDNDGITALVEYALGLSPRSHDVLPGVVRNGNNVSISFPKGIHAAGDSRVVYEIWSSINLGTWNLEAATQNPTTISFSEAAAQGGKKFYRLKVVFTP